MTIKVKLVDHAHMLPILVSFGDARPQRCTKKAVIELKNKLEAALSELEVCEAMKGLNADGSIDH